MQEWMPIPGFEDCYQVSDKGDVRRISTRSGKPTCKPCKPTWSRGYSRFVLCKNGRTQTISGHKLVWISFRGPIPLGMQINHKNGRKADNSISNLELCTQSENTLHAFRVLGVAPNINPSPGSRNGRAKLKETDIPEIKNLYASGLSQQKIADRFGVDQTSISRIVIGKGWLNT
jgi:hypothetical protein